MGFKPISQSEMTAIRAMVREGRDLDSNALYKATTDELGHTVTEFADGRVDLTLRPQTLTVTGLVNPAIHSAAPCKLCGHERGDHLVGVCPPRAG